MIDSRPVDDPSSLPVWLPVNVLMERRPGVTRWAEYVWEGVGVMLGEGPAPDHPEVVVAHDDYLQVRYGGFRVHFHPDEAADHYHNITSPAPGCYIVARLDTDGDEEVPRPVKVTLSFDEANAYAEGDAPVYHVPLGADLYQWVERFVLTHYAPEPKRKRKLKSAREQRGFGEPR